MNVLRSFAFSAVFSMLASAVAAQVIAAVIEQCNDCHGDNGVSLWNDMPTTRPVCSAVSGWAISKLHLRSTRPASAISPTR